MSGYRATGGMASRAHQDGTVTPVPDKVAGTVFPYRGTEQHGVQANQEPPAYLDDQWPEDSEAPHYVQGPTEEDPLPGKIVQESSSERMMFRTNQMPVSTTEPKPIVDRLDSRRNVTVKNPTGGNDVWISPDENVNAVSGFLLEPGEQVTLRTTEQIWAITETAQTTVHVLWEYAVPV